jgi:hypothetical protein
MKVDVIEVTEQPDGSARVTMDLDEEALSLMVEKFVVQALTEQIEVYEKGQQE